MSHLTPHSSLLLVHSSYSTRSSGWGTASLQSRFTLTISPLLMASFNFAPKLFSMRADGIVMFSMYFAEDPSSSGVSMVINFSSMSSATRTAEAPAFCAFQTFKAKKQSAKEHIKTLRIKPSNISRLGQTYSMLVMQKQTTNLN
ncbi:hypothetical protein V8G54_029440 [Vigna mungo]|uniref:Uncharacterized protein n=1 Tax=Vigna mungo TaxID=3915 RepID=A0AAQ3MV95_VIGMU